jgi:hypothetical protein
LGSLWVLGGWPGLGLVQRDHRNRSLPIADFD